MRPRERKLEKHSYKQVIYSISKCSNYSSGLSFAAIDAGGKIDELYGKFTKRTRLIVAARSSGYAAVCCLLTSVVTASVRK
jgi:hypothetical protein